MSFGKSFTSTDNVYQYANEIAGLIRSAQALSTAEPKSIEGLHKIWSEINNVSVQSIDHQLKGARQSDKKGVDAAMVALTSEVIELCTVLEGKASVLDDNLTSGIMSVKTDWLKAKAALVYVKTELEEAPPLPEVIFDESSGDESDFLPVSSKAKRRSTGKGKGKAKAGQSSTDHQSLSAGTLEFFKDDSAGELPEISISNDDVEHEPALGEMVFPSTSKRFLPLVYEPARNAPFVGTQRIKFADVRKMPADKITWKEVSCEAFYQTVPLSRAFLLTIRKDRLITDSVFQSLSVKASHEYQDTKAYTRQEAIDKFGKRAMEVAVLQYNAATTMQMLEDAKLGQKGRFIEVWNERLGDCPDDLDVISPSNLLKHYVKRALRGKEPKTEINKTFMSFKIANLLVWRPGQTREEMIEKSSKSLKAFWGKDAMKYVEHFKQSPLGRFEIRPKEKSLIRKARQTATEMARRAAADSRSFASATATQLKAAQVKAREDMEFAEEALPNGSFFTRSKFVFRRMWNRLAETGPAVKSKTTSVFANSWKGIKNGIASCGAGLSSLCYTCKIRIIDNEVVDEYKPRWWVRKLTSVKTAVSSTTSKLARKMRNAVRWVGYLFYEDNTNFE